MPSNFSITLGLTGKTPLYHVVFELFMDIHMQPGSLSLFFRISAPGISY